MIEVRGARSRLGTFHLVVEDLRVDAGEYLVLLGPSGAGKSVLLEAVAGLRALDAGRILIEGEDVTDFPPERRRVGLVSQRPSLFPHMSVRENIGFGGRYVSVPRREFAERVERVAGLLRVEHLLERAVTRLSGGEAQRVTLARALVTEPRVLLLDEPLGPLDQNLRADLIDELRRVHANLKTTTIHVTHDPAEARALADCVAVMEAGAITQAGPREAVFARPAGDFLSRLLGRAEATPGAGPRDRDDSWASS